MDGSTAQASSRSAAGPGSLPRWLCVAALLLAMLAFSSSAQGAAGFQDFSFGTAPAAPSTKEPQSKLWFNDGIWWASLYRSGIGFRIHRLNTATQTWTDTGTTIDTRSASRADTLWDGTKLYVASANPTETGGTNSARIYRFSYNASTDAYTLDAGFPVTISTGGMQAITIAKDSRGTLWAAYTQAAKVMVTHTTSSDSAWVTPYVLPATASTGLLGEDEADITAYNGKIGILWSKQTPGSEGYLYAEHVDGAADTAWASSAPLQAPEISDNHLSLSSLSGDPAGQVFAAVKTSLNASGQALYYVMVLSNSGTWQTHVFGRTEDNHTRVQLALDTQNRTLYAFGSTPCCSGGAIYYKATSLDAPSFVSGLGTPLIQSATSTQLNDVTTTRQPVNDASGLAVVAGDTASNLYFHNHFGLGSGDTVPPDTTIDSGVSGSVAVTEARFDFSSTEAGSAFQCRLDGSAFTACDSGQTYSGLSDGSHTFTVRAIDLSGNIDPSPASRTWSVVANGPTATFTPDADATIAADTPEANFGSTTTTTVDASPLSEGLVRFAVTGIDSRPIIQARLRLFATNGTTNGPLVYLASNAWSESGVTWDVRPTRLGAPLANSASIPVNTTVEYDVTAAVTSDGTYTFDLVADSSDAAGFVAKESTNANKPELLLNLAPPTVPPDTSITSTPIGSTASTGAAFTFTGTNSPTGFECRLDGAAFAPCTSPASYGGLSVGSHTFSVRGINVAGADPTPASETWTVTPPTAAPDTSITSAPIVSTTANSATFTFTGTNTPTGFECRLDGAAFAPCTSPASYSGLVPGSRTFEVRAVNGVGPDPTPAGETWFIRTPIFNDGFESADLSAWTSVVAAAGGTASVQGTIVRTGSFAAGLSATGTAGSVGYIRRSFGTPVVDLSVGADVNVQTQGLSGGNVPILRLFDSGGVRLVNLYRQNSSSNRVYISLPGASGVLTTGLLPLGTWKRFEIDVIAAGTGASTVRVRMDGAIIHETTSASLGSSGILTLQLGNETSAQAFSLAADGVTASAG